MIKTAGESRKIAWMVLLEFERCASDPDKLLAQLIPPNIPRRDRALAWEIAKGAIKYLKKLDFIAQAYIKAPLRAQKPQVLAALRIGLYQLVEMTDIPQFAAVDETVRLVSEGGMIRDAGFVNAVLRSFIRDPSKIDFPDPLKSPIEYLSIFYSFPDWLVRRWYLRYGFNQAEQMLSAYNLRQNVSFKIILSKGDITRARESLAGNDIEIETGKYFPDFIRSSESQDIISTEYFKAGNLLVQDESQGLPVYLLDPPRGASVLDLCSAPGGKTISLADRVGPEGSVASLDKDAKRLEQVRQNADRIGFRNIEYIASDLLKFALDRKFKYILLDVPCSGLGTMAHNVDLRWVKKEKDIAALARVQYGLLTKAAEFLENGGRMVYSSCTTEPDEIENVLAKFLSSHPDFRLESAVNELVSEFEIETGIYRTWPHKHGIGGGGFGLLRKKDES